MYGYSTDGGEQYHGSYATEQDAISAGRDETDGPFLVADGVRPGVNEFLPSVNTIVEIMQESAADETEWSGDWLDDLSPSARWMLKEMLRLWAAIYCPVTWLVFGKGKEIEGVED